MDLKPVGTMITELQSCKSSEVATLIHREKIVGGT
jgi:hypothetical protein